MEKKCESCGHSYDTELTPGMGEACPKCMANLLMEDGVEPTILMDPSERGRVALPDDAPLKPGSVFNGIEILTFLGRGGMGYVYEARQPKLDRTVALKILDPALAEDDEFTRRFNREAKALASLNHPTIVQVYDYGQEDGLYYLIMEYIDGTTLRQILTGQRIDPATALRYVPQICDALEYAHSQGVIHRDIKPENILIDRQGTIKIADFGLAKMHGGNAVEVSQLTMSGNVMGTLNYMAPEQLKEFGSVDHRADIYALGVVFYEMLTGELPVGHFPTPSEAVRVDVKLDEVVLKALASDPERRYQQASQVKIDLGNATGTSFPASGGPSGPRADGSRLSLLALWGALGTPMAVVAGLLGSLLAALFEAPVPAAMAVLLTSLIALIVGVSLSIAGLVVISNSGGRLRGKGLAQFGIFFPVGMILFLLGASLFLIRPTVALGGEPTGPTIWGPLFVISYLVAMIGYACFCFIKFLRLRAWVVILVALLLTTPAVLLMLAEMRRSEATAREAMRRFEDIEARMKAEMYAHTPEAQPWGELVNLAANPQDGEYLASELQKIVTADLLSSYTEGAVTKEIHPQATNGQRLKQADVLDYIARCKDIGIASSDSSAGRKASLTVFAGSYTFEIPVIEVPDIGWRLGDCELVEAAVMELMYPKLSKRQGKSALETSMENIILPTVKFEETPLKDVIEFLRYTSAEKDRTEGHGTRGVNIILDLKGVEVPPVTFDADGLSLAEVLRVVTQLTGTKWRIDGNVVMIEPNEQD